jgi:hypothetical protein
MSTNVNEEKADIKEILLALQDNEKLSDREIYGLAVQNYQNYLVPFLSDKNNARQIFTMPGPNNSESIPVFLSEEIFRLFQNDYLKKHGYLERISQNQQVLSVRSLTGQQLFELMPKSSLPAFFVLYSESEGFLMNFKLAKVFTECFQTVQNEIDLDELLDPGLDPEPATGSPTEKIRRGQKFRALFENNEWIVLISQPTHHKLLAGEVSRHDFDLDRHDDRRVVIFSDLQAFENFKKMTGQTEVKFRTIKVGSERIFGSDLSKYEIIIIDPEPPRAVKIGSDDFTLLNELFSAFEIERTVSNIKKFRLGYGPNYIKVKEFQKFILPVDNRLSGPNLPFFNLPVRLVDEEAETRVPVFTGEDCFEAFRLQWTKKLDSPETNFMEPYFIDGRRLFKILSSNRAPAIVFNPGNSVNSIRCEPNFALKVFLCLVRS